MNKNRMAEPIKYNQNPINNYYREVHDFILIQEDTCMYSGSDCGISI